MDQQLETICIKEDRHSNLVACLNRYTKPQLKEIVELYGEKTASSAKKQDLVLKAEELIKTSAREGMQRSDESVQSLMETLCQKDLPLEDVENREDVLTLTGKGLVYLKEADGMVSAFVPQDIRVILDAPAPEEDVIRVRMPGFSLDRAEAEQAKYFEEQKKAAEEPAGPIPLPRRASNPDRTERQTEIIRYARALANMYGVYPVTQLKDVWDFNHSPHISPVEVEEAVAKLGDEDGLVTDGRMIANGVLETVEECDAILEKTGRRDVFFYPQEEEVLRFVDGPVISDSEEYYFLRTFLARWIGFDNGASYNEEGLEKSAEIMKELYYCAMRDTSAGDVVKFLVERHISFTDLNDLQRFIDLYTMWTYQLRMWVVKGYKPAELKPEIAQRLNFKLPMDVDPMRRIKLGRNDACLCGSGKKYKNCCLKIMNREA